jgi:hypothetical protein
MRKFSKIGPILLALGMVVSIIPLSPFMAAATAIVTESAETNVDHTTYGWAQENAKKNPDGTVTIKMMEVPNFEVKTYTTATSLADADHSSPTTGVSRADALTTALGKNAFVEVKFNSKNQAIDMELIEYGTASYMDSASYGGELTAKGGGAGSMVAQGWVLDKNKDKNTITIGDGNHNTNVFEQTYLLSEDVKIYVVDSPKTASVTRYNPSSASDGTWSLKRVGTFDDINVTAKMDGEIYYTPQRWVTLCVFDSNYKTSWKDGKAKVKEIYLFDDPSNMADSEMYTPDGMQYSGTSWYPEKSRAVEETNYGYAGSAEPIEFMKNRLYSIGDTYTSIMLFVGDDGTLSVLDMGNDTARYQYYLNIEKCGYDPRSVDNIFLTHGHGDHYAAMYEFATMVRRGGNKNFKALINPYAQNGVTFTSASNNEYILGPTLTDKSVLYSCNAMMEWDKWLDFLGSGISTYIWPAMGHSNDTASYVFKLTAKQDDAYFKKGDIVSFLYFGGYAVREKASIGAMRLSLVNALQYQQTVITPWMEAQSDYIYPLPQHTNQVSALEIDKASKIAGIPFMKGYVGGAEEIGNYCENRIANMLYQSYNDAYENNYSDKLSQILKNAGLPVPTLDWSLLPAASGGVYIEGTRGTKRLDTIEEHGPFKRPEGEYNITVKGVQVIHGYDAFMNKQPLFAGQKNVYGFSLDKGFPILWDTYTHDPDGWFVQVYADVDDSYDGGVDYATNWLTLKDPSQYTTNYDNKGERPTTWESGPVELVNPVQGNYEFLRTQRFNTREEAEAYAKKLTNGAYKAPYEVYGVNGPMYKYSDNANHAANDYGIDALRYQNADKRDNGKGKDPLPTATYKVKLSRASEIQLSSSFEGAFKKVK